jgi:hypothetical protein
VLTGYTYSGSVVNLVSRTYFLSLTSYVYRQADRQICFSFTRRLLVILLPLIPVSESGVTASGAYPSTVSTDPVGTRK